MFQLAFIKNLPFTEKLLWFFGLSIAGWLLSQLVVLIWEKLILPLEN